MYAITLNILGGMLLYLSIQISNIFIMIIFFWLGIDLILIALGYLLNNEKVFNKKENGKIYTINKIILLPYLLYTQIIWYLVIIFSKEDKFNQITEELIIGRRLLKEIPKDVINYIDLTCEFDESKKIISKINYISIPILDGNTPNILLLEKGLDKLKKGKTYVHCAQGHGRTGVLAIILLVKSNKCKTYSEAIKLIQENRKKLKLNKKQSNFIKQYFK